MTKGSNNSNWTNKYYVAPDFIHGGHITLVVFLPEVYNLNPVMGKHQRKPN